MPKLSSIKGFTDSLRASGYMDSTPVDEMYSDLIYLANYALELEDALEATEERAANAEDIGRVYEAENTDLCNKIETLQCLIDTYERCSNPFKE